MTHRGDTKITFLSHASLYFESPNFKLLVDPWLIGSCYWRSWWNYPPVKSDAIKNLVPDAVYITHVHWDHWHGVTLKRLIDKKTLIIIHEEPNKRSVNDLRKIGFKNIKLLKHGQSLKLGDIDLTIYQFGLFLNDSAIVIENRDVKLFNANDCKIAGASLSQIMKRHGKFDFALRSHSSANDRILYKIRKDPDFTLDDPEHYGRAFKLFMDAVRPHYAVPFASNHCHLHKDVYELNHIINDPYQLINQIEDAGGFIESDYKILLSGDSWSSGEGFAVSENKHFFEDKKNCIKEYRDKKQGLLDKFYKQEAKTKANDKIISKFEKQIASIPKFLRAKFKGWKFVLDLFSDDRNYQYLVFPSEAKVEMVSGSLEEQHIKSHIQIPIKIFVDAVALNMFHHSSISKRNKYIFDNKDELRKYQKFLHLLEKVELEVFPLRFSYTLNLGLAYVRRWREIFVYFKALILLRKGLPIYDVEEIILEETKR